MYLKIMINFQLSYSYIVVVFQAFLFRETRVQLYRPVRVLNKRVLEQQFE